VFLARYERTHDVLRLVLELQASATGLCLEDIQALFEVDRRTATRMRDAAVRLFPDATFRQGDDRRRYWYIPRGRAAGLAAWNPEELAALDAAARRARRDGRADQSDALATLSAKLRALPDASTAARLEPDLEALTEGEGLATRAGPRPKIDSAVVADLRHAILARRKVRLHYTRRDGEAVAHKVYPYGFLYGSRHYLVAYSRPAGTHLLYRLPNIARVEVLPEYFERDRAFSLDAFARRSFGVFQEDPIDVVWRFAPEAAADAREFCFHPDQTLEEEPDGSLLVKFRAGGRLEMAWHLFTWGPHVEVVAPVRLRRLLVEELTKALKVHARGEVS
jgi:predicted DNA-binding transcriptional regulator YafY